MLQVVFAVAVLWFFGRTIATQWTELASLRATTHPNWWRVVASGVVVFGSYGVLVETWRHTVVAWGERFSRGIAARIWFVSNLGKYVPGKIWQIGAMGALAQRAGLSAVAAIGSSLVVNLLNVAAGFMVVALAGSAGLAGPVLIPGIAVCLVGVLAIPWLVPGLMRLASRLTGRELQPPRIPPAAIVVALAGCTMAWALYGVAFRELAIALFGPRAGSPATYTAVFTLSYLVGYLTFLAPGGVGARELSLLALLSAAGLEVGAQATLLVIVSRLWLTVLEAVPGLVLLALRQPRLPNPILSQNGSPTDAPRS
ncbi:MAG TPA: lysylphosphatidylglycerol synthase domain-containing protein [Gemmatimonadaceae bacterium]|nr:lysylphosphatidylglycerol synthase domain-containing protein [Gemmatimonadaceae bacterium]